MTLTITDPQGSIDLENFDRLYYGYSKLDQDLCMGTANHNQQYYKPKSGTPPDLNVPGQVKVQLENNAGSAHPELNMTISVTKYGLVNLKWEYSERPETVKNPFRVPAGVVEDVTATEKLTLTCQRVCSMDPNVRR